MEIKDLKEDSENPRWINDARLQKLSKSIERFGDLSGVVFNKRTKTLIAGHQRVKTLRKKQTKIVTKPAKDKFGTIEIGYIEVKEKTGIIKIPLRVVEWDRDTQRAANIAANAHGGQFDNDKLGKMLSKLEKSEAFDIELIGLDAITVHELTKDFDQENEISSPKSSKNDKTKGKSKSSDDDDDEDDEGEFDTIDPDALENELECQCPRCGYKFNT